MIKIICKQCKKVFYIYPYFKNTRKYCSRKCYILSMTGSKGRMSGDKNPCWKGGKYEDKKGYIHIKNSEHPFAKQNGYIMEHRLVMEKFIRRYLVSKEVVHHINGIKSDNRIENLKLMIENEHNSLHNKGRKHSLEQNKKHSEKMKGKISWNKGKHIPWTEARRYAQLFVKKNKNKVVPINRKEK